MKKLIKSRRGVAIELAVGVMFTMIAFTIMLLSTAGLQNRHRNEDYKEFNQMIEINNIGEHVLATQSENYPAGERKTVVINTEYQVEFFSEQNKFEIYRGDDTEPVLTIILNSEDNITSWK